MSSVVRLLQQERTDLHVSVSSIRTLEACPRQWWYRYVAGVPPEDTPARLILGGAMHKALAHFYLVLRDEGVEAPLNDLIGVAGAALSKAVASDPPVLFGRGEDAEGLVLEAYRLLQAFMAEGFRPARIVAVEEPFAVPLHHPESGEALSFEERLVGAMDLVVEDEDGVLVVIDHKISARVDKTRTARPDLQMAAYGWVARDLFSVDEVRLRFQSLVRTKTAKVAMQDISRVPHDEAEGIEAVASALTLIHTAVSHPDGKCLMGRRRSWRCADCSWRRRCAGDRT